MLTNTTKIKTISIAFPMFIKIGTKFVLYILDAKLLIRKLITYIIKAASEIWGGFFLFM